MAERDGLMERLSERYDIFNPGSSALSSAVSEPSGEHQRGSSGLSPLLCSIPG